MPQRSSHTFTVAEQRYEARSAEAFDRIAFAMRVLRVLRPSMTVAVYPRRRNLVVERGRAFRAEGAESWALVGIPPHATRENIANALVELSGSSELPFLGDLLGTPGLAVTES